MSPTSRIGIRAEDKNIWERRVPLTPHAVMDLAEHGVEVWVERFPRRAFLDEDYEAAGARMVDDVTPCELVLGIKEIPVEHFRRGSAYMFFSHTIKGQPHNMPMLQRLVELGCTLFDYELVRDEAGRRLIFFGRYAGLAGMIDTLSVLGHRLEALGIASPFCEVDQTQLYAGLPDAREAVGRLAARIAGEGVPLQLAPLVVGFTGYGNVSSGAQEIFDLLPHVTVAPADLPAFVAQNPRLTKKLVKVVYHECDLVQPIEAGHPFDLQEYFDHPERYHSTFDPHLDLLTVIVNGIYWTERYPRLATREQLAARFAGNRRPRLLVVGDISCDVNGSLACTVRDTDPGHPAYVYDPLTGESPAGFEGRGVTVMAVYNLPCELPMEASAAFSTVLAPFVPALAACDLSAPFASAGLPPELERATILWRGEFTPTYSYMREFLPRDIPREETIR
ncbi:MAG: hypothetical protein KBD01_05545 [Acidobacteria bacterium]|nr:hypothetical protein [Acidobacteriota bacterium]